MFWQITGFPVCSHHVFLSHSQEDRDSLVVPVQRQLMDRGVGTWLDQEDYAYGRSSRAALRDGILRSRHAVFFVTDAMVASPRGWCVLELALAELLDINLQIGGGPLANPALPLFLVSQNDSRLPRSVWQLGRDSGRFLPPDAATDPVEWCVNEIFRFLKREQQYADELRDQTVRDKDLGRQLKARPGLFDRVTKFQPRRLA